MARPGKRRKIKNPSLKVRRKVKNPYNISFNNVPEIVRKNWDKRLTLRQNYEKMGLVSELNGKAGGEAEMKRTFGEDENEDNDEDDGGELKIEYRSFEDFEKMEAINRKESSASKESTFISQHELEHGIEGPIKVEKKAKLIGKKVSTLTVEDSEPKKYPVTSTKRSTPAVVSEVVEELKAESLLDKPVERHASDQEQQVLKNLVAKYGTEYDRMARDRKLNPYQLSAGQLKRKIAKMTKSSS
ncbi:Nucleolar protein 16 [Phlyctochytrium bullatum]|nr:Nucleolar protein 16 [Phlyctochytrium bullatum]